MKTLFLGAMASLAATAAFAGMTPGPSYTPLPPSASGGSDSNGLLIVLIVVGGLLAINGGFGTGRAKTETTDTQDDDDVIMKF